MMPDTVNVLTIKNTNKNVELISFTVYNPEHIPLSTGALNESALGTTHGNVIGPALPRRRWPRLDFKMILHYVRYVRRVGHDWAGGGWRAFMALASGHGRRRWCCWSTTTSNDFRRLMAFYHQAVDVNLFSYFHKCAFQNPNFAHISPSLLCEIVKSSHLNIASSRNFVKFNKRNSILQFRGFHLVRLFVANANIPIVMRANCCIRK